MENWDIFILILFSHVIGMVNGEYCYYYNSYHYYNSFNCPRSFDDTGDVYCCGSSTYRYCCNNVSGNQVVPVVGGVLTVLIFTTVIVAIIICCCVASCPLYQKRYRGRVVHPGHPISTVVVSQHHTHITHPHPEINHLYPQRQPYSTSVHQTFLPNPPPYAPPSQASPGYGVRTTPPPAYYQGIYPPPPSYQSLCDGTRQPMESGPRY